MLLVLGLLSVASLAGCTGTADIGAGENRRESGSDPGPAGDNTWNLSFAAPISDQSEWFEGSFGPAQTCPGTGCISEESRHEVDLTHLVPKDVPVALSIVANYNNESHVVIGSEFDLGVSANDATVHSESYNEPERGRIEMEVLLTRHEGFVRLEVHRGFSGPSLDLQTDYRVRVASSTQADQVLSGIPVVVPMEPDLSLVATPAAGGEAELLVYGPDDRFIQRFDAAGNTTFTLADDDPSGDYVFVSSGGSDPATLALSGLDEEPASLLSLRHKLTRGDPVFVEPGGGANWEFQVKGHPMRVGVIAWNEDATVMMDQIEVELVTPGGHSAKSGASCAPCVSMVGPDGYSYMIGASTPLGSESLVPGMYTAKVTVDSMGFQAQHYIVHYER